MNYEIRNQKTARIFFWQTHDRVWMDVIACGGASIAEWARDLKRAGYCICRLKKSQLKEQ